MKCNRTSKLTSLLNDLPLGCIVDTSWFKQRGISSNLVWSYSQQGWIERVIRGVYRLPLPSNIELGKITWETVLISLQRLLNYDIHLGGRNALDKAGYAHFIMMGDGQRIDFYGSAPSWLNRLPTRDNIVVTKSTLFEDHRIGIVDHNYLKDQSDWAAGIWRWPIKVSTPERAILELIDQLNGKSDFEYVQLYFESLVSLNPELLMELLQSCRSIKARRLFFVYADYYQHSWRKHLDTSSINFGHGPRMLVPNGRFHPIYKISLPENFLDTSYEDNCIF
ncbi:MAG: type IV toxin-antitoxin system AbiEi family antitoxin domain-containing protein [Bacteroidetes bacterium]|nr:type IV toxin-antitoxin system AbiEi family antitoxin domain-containing protein [Bacteroidota bacterium]